MNKIKHLYSRAGFGLSPDEWRQRRDWSVEKAVADLFTPQREAVDLPVPEPPSVAWRQLSKEQIRDLRMQERRRVADCAAEWMLRMGAAGEDALLERMTLFWHGHFACTIRQAKLGAAYLNTLRRHALGSFRELTQAVARDVAMIRFLNNQQNRKEQPNENFARELLELFTIGRGQYSERDIKEAARAFTGWSSNLQGDFVFRERWHDYGMKEFFGRSGRFNGNDIVDMVLDRRETAEHLVRKLYRYFVHPVPDEGRVQALAAQYYESDYDTGALMRAILGSDWFYASGNMGVMIKSPVSLLAGMIRTLSIAIDEPQPLIILQRALGQQLFNPPNVAGWPGDKAWIDNATLMLRLNLPGMILSNAQYDFRPKDSLKASSGAAAIRKLQVRIDLAPLQAAVAEHSEREAIAVLREYLLATPTGVSDELLFRAAGGAGREEFVRNAVGRIMSLPEYQVC